MCLLFLCRHFWQIMVWFGWEINLIQNLITILTINFPQTRRQKFGNRVNLLKITKTFPKIVLMNFFYYKFAMHLSLLYLFNPIIVSVKLFCFFRDVGSKRVHSRLRCYNRKCERIKYFSWRRNFQNTTYC